MNHGFNRCSYEHALIVKIGLNGEMLIVCLYVDDLIFTENCQEMISDFREAMTREFEMADMGLMYYFLGLEITQSEDGIFICQQKYAKDILEHFKMATCKPISTPMEERLKLTKDGSGSEVDPTYFKRLVGSLRYLTSTRPDLVYSVGMVSRCMETHRQSHLQAVKRILRYIKGNVDDGVFYTVSNDFQLMRYTDSDWGGDIRERKSTSGYVFSLGNGIFSWFSKKQQVVALSSAEAKYIAEAYCATQAIWLHLMFAELRHKQKHPTMINCDNKSAIALAKNLVFHGRSKHIDIKYHFIRDLVKSEEIVLQFCKSEDQVADMFTKPLKTDSFLKLKRKHGQDELGLREAVGNKKDFS
ncbi:uncharacterized mitochondrial protein AtMg00810-like [Syzygium oleosum]|uniref:uncharacterized mitochondrial protein AtMg00810-like n=1 Tax=Syzygium oleosum TaxID=219896 RepID=UPI0011D2B0E5|nr:uncharacterized mitochondrial protein AtMg00810-like [Syzygium oleosum]